MRRLAQLTDTKQLATSLIAGTMEIAQSRIASVEVATPPKRVDTNAYNDGPVSRQREPPSPADGLITLSRIERGGRVL